MAVSGGAATVEVFRNQGTDSLWQEIPSLGIQKKIFKDRTTKRKRPCCDEDIAGRSPSLTSSKAASSS